MVGTGNYSPWGVPDSGSVTLNGFGFTGEQVDPESGFVYLRNRYYDPTTSRFLTPDPLGSLGSGVNLYAYVGNNPATLTDPTGLGGKGSIGGGGGAGFYDPGLEETAKEAANGVRGLVGRAARGIQRLFGGGAEESAPPMDVNPETQQCLAPVDSMADTRRLGNEGEANANINKSTERIPSESGKAKYRIPDEINRPGEVVKEVKNVKYKRFTSQIQDELAWAEDHGMSFELIVREDTQLSAELQQKVDNGEIILRPILPGTGSPN